LANRSVVLYRRTKIKKKWAYSKVTERLSELACGEYYLSWYDGKRKHLDPVGSDPEPFDGEERACATQNHSIESRERKE
jgi:hypothetical protein